MAKNIVLVGFMGTGKTVVGKRLAALLYMRYVNTDDIIEENQRRQINEIFTKYGEEYFRKVEKEVIRNVSKAQDTVITAGGGAVLDDENMRNLGENGIIICLTATAEEIFERTKNFNQRPLLNVPSPLDVIKQLMEKRRPYYAKAHYAVDTSGKSIDEVIKEVMKIVKDKL